jgi:hypothetical protein
MRELSMKDWKDCPDCWGTGFVGGFQAPCDKEENGTWTWVQGLDPSPVVTGTVEGTYIDRKLFEELVNRAKKSGWKATQDASIRTLNYQIQTAAAEEFMQQTAKAFQQLGDALVKAFAIPREMM